MTSYKLFSIIILHHHKTQCMLGFTSCPLLFMITLIRIAMEVSLPFSSQRGTMSAGGAQGRRRGEGHLGRRSIDLSGALSIFKTKLGNDILKK